MTTQTRADVGFIGLGVMGALMAQHLTAVHRVYGFTRSGVPEDLQAAGILSCVSPRDIAAVASIVILMLPTTDDVETVLFGPQGVLEAQVDRKLVIDMSSISPTRTRNIGQRVEAAGGQYVDAPVSGGQVGARNASLSIMVGGSEEAFTRARPFLERMGKAITHVGPIGSGQVAKVANQIIVGLTIEAVSEALVFASKAGADPARVRQALLGGFAASRILELHGQRMIERTFEPGFRIALHRKDLGLALESARELAVALPGAAACHELMNAAVASGYGQLDHSALVKVIETLSACKVDEEGVR